MGRPARIIAKMNQLEDPEIIEGLCEASTAYQST
jgi:polyphosphate kinase